LGRWNIIFPRLGNQRFFVAEEKIMEENGEIYGKSDYVFHMSSKKVSFYLASDLSARG